MSGNTFGQLFRVTSFGESHGTSIGCIIDGVPPRIPLGEVDIQPYVEKRRPGQSKYTTSAGNPIRSRSCLEYSKVRLLARRSP